jgi:hypothetical protein
LFDFLTPLPFIRSLNAVKHCTIELGVDNVEIPVLHHLLIPIFFVYLNLLCYFIDGSISIVCFACQSVRCQRSIDQHLEATGTNPRPQAHRLDEDR